MLIVIDLGETGDDEEDAKRKAREAEEVRIEQERKLQEAYLEYLRIAPQPQVVPVEES